MGSCRTVESNLWYIYNVYLGTSYRGMKMPLSLYINDVHFCVYIYLIPNSIQKLCIYIYAKKKNVEGGIKHLITIRFQACWGFYFLLYIHLDNLKFMISIYFYCLKKEIKMKETGEFTAYNTAQ